MSRLKGPITIAALLSLLLMLVAPTVWARPPTLLAAMAKGDAATAVTPKQDDAGSALPWKLECPQSAMVHTCNGAGASINKPICGVSEAGMLRSFTNRCYFELHNCMSKGSWVVLHDGPC